MNGPRALIRDPRMAVVVVVAAVLLVGYRFLQRPSSSGAWGTDPRAEPAAAVTPGAGVIPREANPQGSRTSTLPAAPAEQLVPEAPWSLDRNPFLETEKVERIYSMLSSSQHETSSEMGRQKLESSDSRMGFRGTVISEAQAIAIFGDRIVLEGGKVGEWTLEKVAPYRVSMRRGSENRILETCQPLAQAHAEKKGETP